MTAAPPEAAVAMAIEVAGQSPCAKSNRGVAVFRRVGDTIWIAGHGSNGPPPGFVCTGSAHCRSICAQWCVHAEARAIRMAAACTPIMRPWRRSHRAAGNVDGGMLQEHEAVHVKVVGGELVPSGGPSCWQCSREVLDSGLDAFWLYEEPTASAPALERNPILRAVASVCRTPHCPHVPPPGHRLCATCDPPTPAWRRYTAFEFHAATLRACGLAEVP